MDGDPAVDSELDTFSLILPLPYRIAFILVLGVWAWGVNLHYLYLLKIDVPTLIKYPTRSSSPLPHHQRTYALATTIALPLILSLLFFWTLTRGRASYVLAWDIIPQSYLFLLFLAFLIPYKRLSPNGRYRFLTTLKRISIGGIAETQDGKFGDILLADVLTSYAKVLGDFFVSLCMFFTAGRSSTDKPDRGCGGQYIVPIIISIPSLIRLRQCLIEYMRVRNNPQPMSGQGWGGQHLANALKYSSAFPVIILSALQRGYDPNKIGLSETGLFRLWLFSVFLNSLYSFYWDVAKDWDLTLFPSILSLISPTTSSNPYTPLTPRASSASSSSYPLSPPASPSLPRSLRPPSPSPHSQHPWGLRRHTHFHTPLIYYTAIVIDLLLRFTWSLKLSPHLDHWNDLEGSIFVMEVLEVVRRWVWIFFRVETEWVRVRGGVGVQEEMLLAPL
ncbi:MAG: hypothetical protein L6R37_007338 [Teloschistes peruensis]|nr:MAG: hypothetical protein L6R37_007338 [Teloschistes peruensis]